ncbi:GNAT family N-acetyltransferase [Tsukamurella paurometabola]|uniref:GNAT family N-acetyltransferase n=1 Tax=Tsukamurella paurometabola TaxID=2061 RepID=A0A3P8KNT2_TSUPA|nr:GNAT family N-acetyltransferase [Tsukamurella paurometabola]MBS4103625.1 GNAT family N-acetyltransferase [Tsukamurella paurometabola]UEA85090.1 GNAT family N-acetyltransferase [Tsukamurella paurometabola]VDR37697.1 Protease synthase and sporulation negative regulatory protein PAI 1 [Tsukamurella paurometabola]
MTAPIRARVRRAGPGEAAAVAALAARTFPLACPPTLSPEHIDDFVAAHLSEAEFDRHLADPAHRVLVVDGPDGPVGYALVLHGVHDEGPAALRGAPSAYLSKLYVDPGHHGGGVARALLDAVRADAGGLPVWLGVNADNARAKRFYAKSGFVAVGVREFTVGGTTFVDDVLVLDAGGE